MGSISTDAHAFVKAPIEILNATPNKDLIRSFPELVEFNSKYNGSHLFCVQAVKNSSGSYDLLRVSNLDLKQAILRCSSWLVANIKELELPKSDGKGIVKGKPVALFAESNVGIIIYLFSLLHLGIPVILLSARLSAVAFTHLLKETSAVAVIASQRLQGFAKQANAGLPLYQQASFQDFIHQDLLDGAIGSPNHYISDRDRKVIILHSSGSTGLPKPIYQSHRYLLGFTQAHLFNSPEEAEALTLSTLPLYHGYGLITPGLSLGVGQPFCLPPSDIIPSAASTVDLLHLAGAKSLMTVPSILEDIALSPNSKDALILSNLNFVAFGGGPLKSAVGDSLAGKGMKLLNHYGATEVGPLAPMFIPPKNYDWRYFRLRKDMNLSLKPTDQPHQFALTAYPFGWDSSFEIQDSLVEDLNNPGLDFGNVGRKDDVLILATGEKVNPRILEAMLEESSEVKAAVAFGENRFEVGVIVEPNVTSPTLNDASLRDHLWSIVSGANAKMDAYARISSPAAIVILHPSQTLPRSDKGSIMRKEVYRVFELEIEHVYRQLEEENYGQFTKPLNMSTLEDDLAGIIGAKLGFAPSEKSLGFDDDLFTFGMDSLQSLRLRRLLSAALSQAEGGGETVELPRDFIYRYPSISQLASALRSRAISTNALGSSELFFKYLQTYCPRSEPLAVILITGATGSLGSHVLAHLTSLSTVAQIICLNRVSKVNGIWDPLGRQRKACANRKIVMSEERWSKVEVIETDFTAGKLGLSDKDYVCISSRVTHVLHNAWPLNFKWNLKSFEGQFAVLQKLIQLGRDSYFINQPRRTRFIFLSSIAVVAKYSEVFRTRLIPEVSLDNGDCTNNFGYGQAKLICEKIVEHAAQRFPGELETVSVRIGQMSAAENTGFWSHTEHISALVKSSQSLGVFPLLKGTCSWLPVDKTAEVLSDILLATDFPHTPILHLENPVRQSWHELSLILASNIGIHASDIVPYEKWLQSISKSSGPENPAYNLLEFFEADFQHMACGSVQLDTSVCRKYSPTLGRSDAISDTHIIACIDYWKTIGFLK